MTEEKYLELLKTLRKRLDRSTAKEALEILEDMFTIKPVRLEWFIAKAEALALLDRWEEGRASLDYQYYFHYEETEAVSYVRWYRNWKVHEQDLVGADHCRYLEGFMKDRNHPWEDSFVVEAEEKLCIAQEQFLEQSQERACAEKLTELYFTTNRIVEFTLMHTYCNRFWGETNTTYSPVFHQSFRNMGHLEDRLNSNRAADTFAFVIDSEEDVQTVYTLAVATSNLGFCTYLLLPPMACEVDVPKDMEESARISLENQEEIDGIHVIYPVELVYEGGSCKNQAQILKQIAEQAEEKLLTVLAPSYLMDEIVETDGMEKCMDRLNAWEASFFEEHFAFGYVGDYMAHISSIYKMDAAKELEAPAECAFSIILPVRNSIDTLQSTLQTCINQRSIEDYEIVISDNSEIGNQEVFEFIQKLNDPHIRYYRTPRELPLPKSFEYAFLKARGEFLLSLGADDALLPWALETMSMILNRYPDDDVLLWERGFYIWPNFSIKQQRGQFVIPRSYRKGDYGVELQNPADELNRAIGYPNCMYALPTLYINSGCRRRYLKKLLEKTGRLWDGSSQDIYMAVINSLINQRILRIAYPLSLAGMSSASIGALNHNKESDPDAMEKLAKKSVFGNQCGVHNEMPLERLVAVPGGIDRLPFYGAVLRSISYRLLSPDCLEKYKPEFILEKLLEGTAPDSAACYPNLKFVKYQAECLGEEANDYIENGCYKNMIQPREELILPEGYKSYIEGFGEGGNLVLDSRKFGIETIEGAVKLFADITNL